MRNQGPGIHLRSDELSNVSSKCEQQMFTTITTIEITRGVVLVLL